MLGKLALQRTNVRFTHLTALAVMAALVVGLFATLSTVAAHELGECSNPEFLTASKCRMEVAVDADNDPSTPDIKSADGTAPANNDPWTSYLHTATNHPPTVSVTFHDSDNIVSASAGQVTGTITVSGILPAGSLTDSDNEQAGIQHNGTQVASAPTLQLAWIRVSGELDHASSVPVDLAATPSTTDDNSAVSAPFTVVIPSGTTAGQYTVSATVISGTDDLHDYSGSVLSAAGKSGSKSFEVGDAGVGLASATLSLGNRVPDDKATVSDESRAESGSDVADGDGINLVVTASNSLGNKSNDGDVTQITVIAPGGNITVTGALDATTTSDLMDRYMATGINSAALGGTTATDRVKVGQTISVNVKKADQKPDNVDVYVILTGSGAAISETHTLRFTGDASALALGDASGSLFHQATDGDDRDKIAFALSATDAGGNDAGVPKATLRVMNPSGVRVSTNDIGITQGPNVAGVPNALVTVTSKKAAPASLKAGEYTVKVTAGGNSAEQTFNVIGDADAVSVTIESSTDEVQLGSLLTVSATVTSDGENVAEKTSVTFTSAGALKLTAVDANAGNSAMGATKAGVATASFVVSEGSGLATVIASAKNASGTDSVSVAAEAPEAMPEEEASVSCLSNLSGFSTWSCGVESSAAEIFGLVSGRGASAVHLWNGSEWVRYSVVEGAMVPGSSDFMVTEDDILYISN